MSKLIPTTQKPNDPNKFYFRVWYTTFFFGGFDSIEEVGEAMKQLDKLDRMWDYNTFSIIKGLDPLPEDFVYGFPFVSKKICKKIDRIRRGGGWVRGFIDKYLK
jgi:hypothetical protein